MGWKRIALTGKGMKNNVQVHRPDWIKMIEDAGYVYTDTADNCDILVASRTNTVKAKTAAARGAQVITYEALAIMLDAGVQAAVGAPAPPPAPIDTTEMEGSALWGLF
ncbi:hypothetical protein SAMN03159338_1518 [Sphingomonas sp. NFR04]|uniref:hypothetical protein n=1 Tax=Sphingomonas sp. NFR04 TaxID=1566283 RepID=UPI0008F00DD7|nr:hypothetical protein [Sphingomonas sp. NFR04]SFJ48275.1 hypothetical protein SAMN03159338_1518 [Sphingomonas sp. NFR04]